MSDHEVLSGWRPFTVVTSGSGLVVEAVGRRRQGKGLPLVSILATQSEDLGAVSWHLTETSSSDRWTYDPVAIATRADFTVCPICLSDGELTDEHVPPGPLGGSVLTRTCRACNSTFGSYEDALLRRAEQRYTMAVRGPSVRGERKVGDVILRRDDAGRLMMTTWNGCWPDWFDEVLASDGHEFQLERPCECRAYAAVLKNAYLAACAMAPEVVTYPSSWPIADLVRQQLLAWRDAGDKHLTLAPRFNRLHVRYDAPRVEKPAVTLCQATHRETGERRQVIRLGWQLVVDWPIDAARVITTQDLTDT